MKGCSPKCFEVYTDSCVEYTGSSYPMIGVSQGNSISDVLDKLASALVELRARVDACSFCNGEPYFQDTTTIVNTTPITYSSVNEFPSNARIQLDVNPTSSSIPVTYVLSNLPEGTVLASEVKVEGMKNNYPATILSTSGVSGGFELKPDNFPAKLISKTRLMTSSGEKEYNISIPLNPSGQSLNMGMYVRETGTPDINTQADVNVFFDKEISSLKSAINSLQTVNSGGSSMPITEKILEIENRLGSITG